MKLSELLSKPTKPVDPPKGTPSFSEIKKEGEPASDNPVDKTSETETPVSKPEDSLSSEEEIRIAGEINTDMFCFGIETPCQIFNGLSVKFKKKKARKTLKGKDLERRLRELEELKKENSEIITVQDDEYRRLQSAFTNLARLNKGKPNPYLMISTAIIGSIARRAEIFFE